MPVVFYDSIGEFHASLPDESKISSRGGRAERWNGDQTYTQARDNLFRGDPDTLAASEKLLAKIETDGLELAQAYWDNDRVGYIPCIPSFLAGSPESMRRLQESQTDTAPIKIFNDVCLSRGFSSRELARRGTAILALARKLQAVRPVELWLYASMHGRDAKDGTGSCAIPVIKIDTSPLDLTTASYALANAGFLRQLCFGWGDARGFSGSWAWNGMPGSNHKRIMEVLKAEETDLVIDGAYLSDQLMSDPLQWVNNQIRKYSQVIQDLD
jgi:hypothetical protein